MAIRNVQKKPASQIAPANTPVVEGETVLPTDTLQPARIGLWVLGVGFGGFLLWAGLAPLDEGVPTQGTVTIETKRKAVQHVTGGIVKQVFVKEGQHVKSGSPLISLDDALVRANYESIRQHYLTLRAMEGRLLAEQAGQSRISFHPDLLKTDADSYIQQTLNNQTQLFQSRRMSVHADMDAIKEAIQGQEASIQGAKGVLNARKNQLEFLQEELKGIRELVKEGYAPRNRQLELERVSAEVTGAIADMQGNIVRGQRTVAEMKLRMIQRNQDYRKEVDGQLSEVRREVQADSDKYRASSQDLERMIIRAPAEGQVVGLAVQSVGAVVGGGQKIMDIVPNNESLILEAHVAPHMIDSVHVGREVDVRFSSFAHSPQLVVQGKVDSVSADLIYEPGANSMPYYLIRASITPEGMKALGNRQMQPGMPAEVMIKTGERSLLTYLLHPLLKRMAASMKEE